MPRLTLGSGGLLTSVSRASGQLRHGEIKPSDLRPGTKLTITGHPMKDGRTAAIWVDVVRADGKKFNPRAGFAVRES